MPQQIIKMNEANTDYKVSPHFWFRRLHSLAGVFPIGAFLLEHMFSNSFILKGPEAYNAQIKFLTGLPYVIWLEIFGIYLPILYHAFYGIYVWLTGKNNLRTYPYKANWLFVLQRWTGILTLIYIGYHVYETRLQNLLYGTEIDYAYMAKSMSNPAVLWFYIAGMAAVMFHFANGLWGFFISWGITVGDKARKVSGWLCTGLGLLLFVVGVNALIHLVK